MNLKNLFTAAILLVFGVVSLHALPIGSKVATESALSSSKYYIIYQPRNACYIQEPSSGTYANKFYCPDSNIPIDKSFLFQFISNGDGTYKIKNVSTGNYMPKPTAEGIFSSTTEANAGSWNLQFDDTNGAIFPICNNYGWNRGSSQLYATTGVTTTYTSYTVGTKSTGISVYEYIIYEWAPTAEDVCTINNTNSNRGALMYNGSSSYVWSSGKSGSFDASSDSCRWVFYPAGTSAQYYLYNVGAKKFAIPTGISSSSSTPWVFSDNAVAVTLDAQSDGTFKIKMAVDPVSGSNNAIMSVSNNYAGPIINWDDAGSKFTITYIADVNESSAVTSAVEKLASSQTALTTAPSETGWYAIQISKKQANYLGRFIYTTPTLYSSLYPLAFDGAICTQPAISDATYFTRIVVDGGNTYWQLPDGRYLMKNGSNKFPIPTTSQTSMIAGYDNGSYLKSGSYYADPYNSGNTGYIGETNQYRSNYYIYPVNLATAGLTAWKMVTNGLDEDVKVTCTRTDVSGLTSVYNNGYFFLPSSVTPENNQFTVNIGGSNYDLPVTVDTENHTITSNLPLLTITSLMAEATFTWNGQTQTGKSVTFYKYPGQEVTSSTITVSYSGAEYSNPTLSSTTWDGTTSATVTCTLNPAFFSTNYGDKWIRISNALGGNTVMGLTTATSGETVKMKTLDYSDDAQLWCFVGNATSFNIYNKKAGETLQMASSSTSITSSVTAVIAASGTDATTWKLQDKWSASDGPGWAIFYSEHNGSMSLNAKGGTAAGNNVGYWNNGDGNGGSRWVVTDASSEVELAFAGLDPSTMTTYTQNIASVPITTLGNNSALNLTKDNFSDIITTYLPVGSEVTLGTPKMFQNYSFLGYGGGQQEKTVTTTAGTQRFTATFGNNRKDARYLWEPLRVYAGSGEKDYYRIPAIVTALNGDVIAITDRRFNNASDIGSDHHIDLIGIASSDNGKTWGSEFMIMDGNNGGEKAYGDAAVVADRESNKVLVMACGGNVSYQSSTTSNHQVIARSVLTHNGTTWEASAITTQTSQFYSGDLANCPAMFIGSGSITQSSKVKKGDYYRIYCAVLAKNYGNYVLYSDNFGENWTYLGSASSAASGDEAKVTELPDGSVLLSSRKANGRYFNVWTWTDDTYTTGSWGSAVATNNQTGGISYGGNSTNGDIRMIPAKKSDGTEVVLAMQSIPTGSSRSNVSIYYKELDPSGTFTDPATVAQNWSGPFEVTPHQSAYSAFNQQPDGRIAFYMEEAPIAITEASVGYYMCYVPLTISEITGGDYQALPGTLENGKYYRLVSYNNKYMTENVTENTVVCSDLIDSYAQVWKAVIDGDNIALQNVLTEKYIKEQTGGTSVQYTTESSSSNTFTLAYEGNGVYTFKDKDTWGLHCDASLSVVGWYINETKSKWTAQPVSVDATELLAQRNAFDARDLSGFFTTTACTELKSSYASMTDEALLSAMAAMPTTVKNMALKVKNNAWATYSGWDKTEQDFRITDYKAYSSHTRWSEILGHKHTLGRLSNPTGIWVNAGDYIQVYVGSVPEGESVKLEVAGYGQAYGTVYSLHEGMNALQVSSAGNCFVFYEVDNTNNGTTPYTLPGSYADVTVHIEGGSVQGYFDLTKGDDDDDWTQMNNHLMEAGQTVCLKTDKHVMNLEINRLRTALNGSSVVDMLNVWRNLSQWEDELMGRSDEYGGQERYGQYCNNITSVTALPGDGSPHATNFGTYYYSYSDNSIFNANALLTVADNMWCIAHEQGHNRQAPINMCGNTEISNNLFSNMAVYKQGRFTSRTASIKDVFNDYLDGISWPERVKRSCDGVSNYNQQLLHMNWSLYLFFHVNGKDPDFFPRLFDALRADPMVIETVSVTKDGNNNITAITGGKFSPASTDYLKFYQKCCEVSGYDLTEFFAAYGFFMIPTSEELTLDEITTTNYKTINDYSASCLYVTQDMIDEAKTAVANMHLPKCNIIFMEDRVKAPLATYEGHAEGEFKRINPDALVTTFGIVGETGQYTEFDKLSSAYSYNIKDGVVKMTGTGAVGFKLYDNSGNLVGLYNSNTFILPSSALQDGVLKDGYTLKAADGLGGDAVATYNSTGTTFPMADTWYTFSTPLRNNLYMHSSGAGSGIYGEAMSSSTVTNDMMWKFVSRGDGSYDIVNRNDNSYIDPTASDNTQLSTTSSQPASGWTLSAANTKGLWIVCDGSVQLNQTDKTATTGYKVYNWGSGTNTSDNGCQYAIKEAEPDDTPAVYDLLVSASADDDLSTGKWYVMFDRGANHGYLYENGSNQLYNTNTHPGFVTSDPEKYLVRLVDAGDSKYYLQTGRGNFVQELVNNSLHQVEDHVAVSTGATKEKFTVAKINSTDGHFYIQGANEVVLDANATSSGDAIVVGWGTTVPTSTGGNNDWAFYPVELVEHFAPTATDIYTINNLNSNRGALTSDPTINHKFVWSSGKGGATAFNAESANCQWIFVPTSTPNQYCLYNVGKQKFIVPTRSGGYDGYSWMFSSDAVSLQLFLQSDGTYKINSVSGSIYLSVSNNYTGPIINYNDAGAMFTLTKQADASSAVTSQLTAAMMAIPPASKPMSLNKVGDRSYSTLYLDYDAQTDENTKAYYIAEALDGSVTLTEVANSGRNIPAYTAVVLVNEDGTTNPIFGAGFSVSNGYAGVVAENENLLKGTLVSMTLDFSVGTPYYSLAKKNGVIGFYKYNGNFTIGVNKAYLDTSVSSARGFVFDFGNQTGIESIDEVQGTMNDGQGTMYDLSGRRVDSQLKHGIYIVNGKKVLK